MRTTARMFLFSCQLVWQVYLIFFVFDYKPGHIGKEERSLVVIVTPQIKFVNQVKQLLHVGVRAEIMFSGSCEPIIGTCHG